MKGNRRLMKGNRCLMKGNRCPMKGNRRLMKGNRCLHFRKCTKRIQNMIFGAFHIFFRNQHAKIHMHSTYYVFSREKISGTESEEFNLELPTYGVPMPL
jgi:hypothetical protein